MSVPHGSFHVVLKINDSTPLTLRVCISEKNKKGEGAVCVCLCQHVSLAVG